MAIDIARYEKFLNVRNTAIKIIESFSVHHEIKEENIPLEERTDPESQEAPAAVVKHRHVAVLSDSDIILDLQRLTQEWENRARDLTLADPVRFPSNAFVLAPVPQVIHGVRSMSIAVGSATTSKKYTKASILGRYDRAIRHARQGVDVSHDSTLLRQLVREREMLAGDSETHYRIRNTCSTETICTLTFTDGTSNKVRVPRVGIAFAAPNSSIEIRTPRVMAPRSDRLEHLGVVPLDCSLSGLAGLVYKESEILKARAQYQARQKQK
ncbi:hypothetical protein DVA44_24965 (plasmid) [Leclercia sp. W17]|nr:hypothetical protein DVA44_24965 [Leclercia sp. W17]HCH39822.1 hypothetical protein [Enterobacter sp.]